MSDNLLSLEIPMLARVVVPCALLSASCAARAPAAAPSPAATHASVARPSPAAAWTMLDLGPKLEGNQDDLWCFDADRCVAVNSRGGIWRTDDGGHTWDQTVDQPGTFFRAVAFVDDQVGVASNIGVGIAPWVDDTVVFYRTVDGGGSWSPVDIGRDDIPGICNLDALASGIVWASGRVSGPSWVARSADAGLTWSWFDVSELLDQVIDLEFAEPDIGIVVGSKDGQARVIRTTDAGASWTVVFDGDREGELPWKISFPSAQVGFIGVQNRTGEGDTRLLTSRDGGRTWAASVALSIPYVVKGIGFVDEKTGWMAGEDQAYGTRDGGVTWEAVDGLHAAVNRFRFPGRGVGYAIGTAVWKLDVR